LKGFFEIPKIDKKVTERVKKILEKGKKFLHEELKKVDLESAEKLHPNDIQRVSRALEVYYSTNNKLSDYHKKHNFKDTKYEYIKIALDYDREVIYNRINNRVDQMINNGLIEEVRSLVNSGYKDKKVMKSIGYSEVISYLDNEITKEEAINKIKQHTRNFAKRQTTWLKKEDITWLKEKDLPQKAIELIENFI
jgi:tRNA dimethylallyltransferase